MVLGTTKKNAQIISRLTGLEDLIDEIKLIDTFTNAAESGHTQLLTIPLSSGFPLHIQLTFSPSDKILNVSVTHPYRNETFKTVRYQILS